MAPACRRADRGSISGIEGLLVTPGGSLGPQGSDEEGVSPSPGGISDPQGGSSDDEGLKVLKGVTLLGGPNILTGVMVMIQ